MIRSWFTYALHSVSITWCLNFHEGRQRNNAIYYREENVFSIQKQRCHQPPSLTKLLHTSSRALFLCLSCCEKGGTKRVNNLVEFRICGARKEEGTPTGDKAKNKKEKLKRMRCHHFTLPYLSLVTFHPFAFVTFSNSFTLSALFTFFTFLPFFLKIFPSKKYFNLSFQKNQKCIDFTFFLCSRENNAGLACVASMRK